MLLGGTRLALGDIGVPSILDAVHLDQPEFTQLGADVLMSGRVSHPATAIPRQAADPEESKQMTQTTTVTRAAEANVPTSHGMFRVLAYRDAATETEHLALVSGELSDQALVRVHSECLTGEALGSLKCECGPQLDAAMDAVAEHGGVVIYMRGQEGRGIGLLNKLRAYALQEQGMDTLDANLALGLPADARDYAAAGAILQDLGISGVRLLTNNTDKVAQLRSLGIDVIEQVPLVVGVGPDNEGYLKTKAARMGHVITEAQLHPVAE